MVFIIMSDILINPEQLERLQQKLREVGIDRGPKLVGGIQNYVKIMFGGDIEKFFKENDIEPYYFSPDKMRMYIHDVIVQTIGFEDASRFSGTDKKIGPIPYKKDGMTYRFNANLVPANFTGKNYWKVVGTSGDYGFGYNFLSKKHTMGIRNRTSIYKAIIDRYLKGL